MTICIPETTPVHDRVELLYQLAVQGSTSYSAGRLAVEVASKAKARAQSVPTSARVGDWYKRILAEEALSRVHKVPYVADPPDRDCYRNVDTTATKGGECKGLNVLFVALLIRLGIQACPVDNDGRTVCGETIWIMQPGKPLNHVASVVWLDGRPYWADASIRGARLGESPYDALKRTREWHIVGGPFSQSK